VTDPARVPNMSIMDEHNKVMISRLGERIRAAGMAELGGYSLALDPARKDTLLRVVRSLFPEGLDWNNASFWAGLRPMTPDGPPILGKTRWPNLYLNSGHGSNGWTQACGTARVVADIVAGRTPQIDMQGLTVERFAQ
jgi:D-amino-acid dehydrogenase